MKNKQTGTISRVLSYIKRYNVYMILSLVASVVMVISTLYFPILTGDAIDLIIGKGNVDFVGIAIVLKKMIKVLIILAIATGVMNVVNNRLVYFTVRDIRKDAFRKLQ